jgi:quercetin 2,3-dioxygenase
VKKLVDVLRSAEEHWVGNGFPVRTVFSYDQMGEELSPFLLLDYAGPYEFEPADRPRGVGPHPHRGFETVTLVFDGEVAHADSAGSGGTIGPGDVQWMTAGSGILHQEFHSPAFTKSGGLFRVVQLWANLASNQTARITMSATLTASSMGIASWRDPSLLVSGAPTISFK